MTLSFPSALGAPVGPVGPIGPSQLTVSSATRTKRATRGIVNLLNVDHKGVGPFVSGMVLTYLPPRAPAFQRRERYLFACGR